MSEEGAGEGGGEGNIGEQARRSGKIPQDLTLVKAAVHPAGSHPPPAARLVSNRSAVTVTAPMVPISLAEKSCSGVATVGVGVATGAAAGEGVGESGWGRASISVCSAKGDASEKKGAVT